MTDQTAPGADEEAPQIPESFWNYRVATSDKDGETVVGIHETYYRHGEVEGWSAQPVSPTAPTVEALRMVFNLMMTSAREDVAADDFFSERSQLEAWLEACDEDVLTANDEAGPIFE